MIDHDTLSHTHTHTHTYIYKYITLLGGMGSYGVWGVVSPLFSLLLFCFWLDSPFPYCHRSLLLLLLLLLQIPIAHISKRQSIGGEGCTCIWVVSTHLLDNLYVRMGTPKEYPLFFVYALAKIEYFYINNLPQPNCIEIRLC
ncbi:hypothetical protein QBC46DRAFT_120275 [Diplogelasinospora grovesii]|uniref:Uncharacterized protein n=1 Tax=Diplogelasinospora grovesii TaxID=303347 RepID=A0AAN6N7T0_9PEZI|nr:hypothetical protein QBC46DRAFT_120275 [Diplogelasinospora grovesii]